MADGGGGIRVRVTVAATAVVAIVFVLVGAGIAAFVTSSLEDLARDSVEDRLATLTAEPPSAGPIAVGDAADEFVQVLSDGVPVVSSPGLSGVVAVPAEGTTEVVGRVPGGDGRFLVMSRHLADGRLAVVGRSLSDADEARAAVLRALLLALPVVLAAIAAITWWIVGKTLRPVDSIRAEAGRISAEALDRRVPVPAGGDEIARLAVTLNEMLERLQAGRDRERRFVADASHELRSPISSMRQHAEVAAAHPDSSDVRELSGQVLRENERLASLVDDLLLLARLGEGAVPARKEVDVDDLVLAEAERLRGGGCDVDTAGVGAGRVIGNPGQLERVVRNLSDNAMRHASSTVAFGLASRNGEVVLSVQDDGPGIPVSERERVLERFVRLDEGRGRREGGAGLGLAIVREVVEAHGGGVALGDAPLGGLQVVVRLPSAG